MMSGFVLTERIKSLLPRIGHAAGGLLERAAEGLLERLAAARAPAGF